MADGLIPMKEVPRKARAMRAERREQKILSAAYNRLADGKSLQAIELSGKISAAYKREESAAESLRYSVPDAFGFSFSRIASKFQNGSIGMKVMKRLEDNRDVTISLGAIIPENAVPQEILTCISPFISDIRSSPDAFVKLTVDMRQSRLTVSYYSYFDTPDFYRNDRKEESIPLVSLTSASFRRISKSAEAYAEKIAKFVQQFSNVPAKA
jgi:hypothetical protein